MQQKSNLKDEIEAIKERNKKVEADKAWETSVTRKIIIMIFTYFVVVMFFLVAELPNPFVSAIVPTMAFFLSTMSFPVFKKMWMRYFYRIK